MAHPAQCYLPRFSPSSCGPRRPVSMKVRTTPSQNLELLAAWRQEKIHSLLQTAWALLLYRYIGSKDVCFGYQYLDGSDTANPSTFSLTINEDDSLRGVQSKVADGSGLAQEFGADAESDLGHDGYMLYNTVLMIRICCDSSNDIGNASLQPVLAMTLPDKTRVRLHVKIMEDDVSVFLETWNDEISTEQMKSITNYFEKTMTQILSGEDIAVAALDRFTAQDWSRVCKFNTAIPECHDCCIHEKVYEQVLLRPDSEAVCAWDGSLTYRELDVLASRIALHLQGQGVGPEARVALCFDKSKWYTVAVLAVLKAGGAFVPLDPTHPTSRLQSLVKSVRAEKLICSRRHEENMKAVTENILPLDDEAMKELLALPEEGALSAEVKGHNAAYVIFTSGSTGEPKGTLVEHRAYASGAAAHAPQLRIDHNSRVLQFGAHTFDASVLEILTPLIQGGCVCVPSEQQRLNEIVQVINDMGVNLASLTPTFITFIDQSKVLGLKTLILVGESMSLSHLNIWSKVELINGFGPTECSVAAVLNNKMTRFSDCRDIGLPVGVRPWLVDPEDHDKLVPVGCAGELILEGPTLARGYINNPEKTAEVFIHNPVWANSEGETHSDRRFYKTGDLVRYNSDAGSLTYIGRKDRQIKLHGQRIELGEIEDNLNTDPAVKNCLVFFPKSGVYEGKLVAVLSLSTDGDTKTETEKVPLKLLDHSIKTTAVTDIRHRLSSRLPTYMIPSGWLCVEALPQLASCKLDRKTIANWVAGMEEVPGQDPSRLRNDSSQEVVRSTNEKEDQLASIWSRVLNIPKSQISLEESFLSLGGDSIAAITCMGFCKKHGLGVTVQEVLRSKSIRVLATQVTEISQPTVYEETIEEPFGLSPIQKLHFKVRKEGQGYFNQGVLTRLSRPVSDRDFCRAIETIIKRHSMLRARFTEMNAEGGARQYITEDIDGSYRFRSHNETSDDEIQQAISNSQSCIDAFAGPMITADLFHVNDGDDFLSMTAHHLVVDIVSWRIILEDLEELLLNPSEDLPQSGSLPFQTWSQLQEKQAQEVAAKGQKELDSLPDPEFAYWGLENHQTTYGDVDCETFEMSPEDTRALLMECHKSLETEPIDIFLASLLYGFRKTFTDRPLPAVYNEGHGREVWDPTIDISRTVGWFTILQPILIANIALDDPVDAVIQVKDLRRRVSDNGRQDFARRVLGVGAQKCDHPGPMEISFNYVGQHRDLQRKDGLFHLVNQMAGETGRGGGAADFGEETPRFALFEISALAVHGCLRFSFSFNRYMEHQNLIRAWVASCQDTLKYLGNKLQFLKPRPTLSSFPLLSLNYGELETILSKRLSSMGIHSPDLVEDIYPCSRMQEAILLSRFRGDDGFYAVHGTMEVKSMEGKPDANRLALAWKKVVSRHPMLRTIFGENFTSQNLFCQVVLKTFDARPTFVKCSSASDVLAILDQQPPMNYHEHQPSHRLTVCETANGRLFCRIEMSHTSMDGSSISLIFRDLQLAYSEKLDDHKPVFKNFIDYLQSTPQQNTMDYWCSYLSKLKPCHLPVLTDGESTPKQLKTMRLKFELLEELQRVCEQDGLTLSTAFSTGWGLTLKSFCNNDDVCFSYMASLRDLPVEDIESVVGPVISLLACRMNASGSIPLREALHQVQNDYMEQLPYKHASLIDIQHSLKLSETLFNTGISFRKLPSFKNSPKEAIEFEELGTIYDPAEFPVFINVEVTDDEVCLDFNYWTTALSDVQAQSVARTFLKHLENIVYFQNKEIGSLDGMSDWALNLITMWNRRVPHFIQNSVHEVLDEKAKLQPNALAVVDGDGSFTYAKINELSSTLATYLIKLGVSPGALVPIDFGKTSWQIISVLAVLKAGGICVPMGENCIQNIDQWVIDNEAQVALAAPTRAHFLEGTVPYAIPVGSSLFKYLPSLNGEADFSIDSSNDAYVVFTSGETSTPRPVVLNHLNILARAKAFASALGIDEKTRFFQYSAYTSAMFIEEVFSALLHGGCLCIPSDNSYENLPVSVNALNANCISITPSVASYLQPLDVPEVHTLALLGEVSPTSLNEIWSPKVQLHTFYGTAESSSTSIHKPITTASLNEPLMGSRNGCLAWIVDPSDHDSLVPIGCTGELVLEGPVVANGYLNGDKNPAGDFIERPRWIVALEQTAGHRDEENPDQTKEGRRMFKTGDLARYNSHGSLVFMGRKATETGPLSQTHMWQMEQRMNSFLSPQHCCAVEMIDYEHEPRNGPSVFLLFEKDNDAVAGDSRALISGASSQFKDMASKLHTHLSRSLPSSHVPALYFPISQIPLNQARKLDRQALRSSARCLSADARLEFNFKAYSNSTDIEYWKECLADVEPCMLHALPSRAPRDGFGSTELTISSAYNLHAFCQNAEVDPNMLLQVVWGLVLRSYTGLQDVCFGHRNSNILTCRLRLMDDVKLGEVVKSRQQELKKMLHHSLPLSVVQRELAIDDTTLFNTIFSTDEIGVVSNEKLHSGNYMIAVHAEVKKWVGKVVFTYRKEALADDSIANIVGCFDRVLHSVITLGNNGIVGEVEFFNDASRQKLLEWNATLSERPDKCTHEIIGQRVLERPSAQAICSWDGDFTYAEIDLLSSRLASHLRCLGVKPEVFVAMCFEKSAWAIIAQLAVHKAGGAFASMDPSHPESRLKDLVEDIGAKIILCSSKYFDKASQICGTPFAVCEDSIMQLPSHVPLESALSPTVDNAAYVIFTSGTTGKPKVTVLEHVGLASCYTEFAKALNFSSDTRMLQFSSFTFDVSVLETMVVLMLGGCICMPSDNDRLNDMAGTIRRRQANTISSTPTIINNLDPKSVPALTTIICGGEKMMDSHIQPWADRCFINAYGPSEATIIATSSMKVNGDGRRLDVDSSSIGTATLGRTWIVDPHDHHRLLPVGAVGELVLEGCNVARGYLNNEQKTKQAFIRDPEWVKHDGLKNILAKRERMYLTGDLVYYSPDGTIQFVSRKDTQIKLNGVRIEVEEIEQQCISHLPPNTKVAVEVIVPKEKTMAKCLGAFFTIEEENFAPGAASQLLLSMSEEIAETVKTLQACLRETLPLTMMPKLFFPLRRLPLSSTGKLDRKALHAIIESLSKKQLLSYSSISGGKKQASQGGVSGELQGLWEEALGLAPGSVGADDSFFGLGGDSFSAMKLVGSAHSRGISLSVAEMYANPTLTDMAKCCGTSEKNTGNTNVEPFSLLSDSTSREEILADVSDQSSVPQESISDIYPCSPVQEGLLALSLKQEGAYIAQPVFQLSDGLDLEKFKAAWQETVNELDILRTRIVHTDSMGFLQAVLKKESISWTVAGTVDEALDSAFGLSNHNGGRLVSYAIVQSENFATRYFVWTVHHALYDGWSVPLILRRVEEMYLNASTKKTTLPYKNFISYLENKDMSESDDFWRSQLSNLSCSPFPQNKSSSPDAVRVGNRHHSSIAISRSPNTLGLTLPEIIRAAWAIVVSVHTSSSDVCFGETLMGRNIALPGVTDIAGPVLTTVPTRVQVDNGVSVTQYLQKVRELTTMTIPHQHSGLQRIRNLSGDSSIACDFQNLLVIQSEEGGLDKSIWAFGDGQTSGDFFTHPLTVECKINESILGITLHHDEVVLDSWLAERLIHQFGYVIEQLLAVSSDDLRKVGDLDLLSAFDKKEISLWNQRDVPAVERCVHEIIKDNCTIQPKAKAVCAWDGELSYKELHDLASSFATYLCSRGVVPEMLVPICMDKSLWVVVSILGVLIAGAAYVPLDPSHPTSRHSEIIEEVEARVILCSPQYRKRYAGLVKTIIPVSKETIRAYSALSTETKSIHTAQPSNMAVSIFTSGSTGRPKGIILDHRALASSGLAFGPVVNMNHQSRCFQFASLAFDAAILEIIIPLMHGACICIPSEEERLNDVVGAIQRMNVTWTFLTPSIASIIEPSTVPSLEVLVCGGEKLSREVIIKWAHCVKLMNGYGPTETTIFAVINPEVSLNTDAACIGNAIPCTLTWIVDPENHDRLSPLGAIGELALEGPALAREYLRNPEKTAESFVTEPDWMKSSKHSLPFPRRIYKTGDLVKYNPDGSIVCIGRKDHQVKLHGQRMELGEIEHRLHEDSRIRHVVVIMPTKGLLRQRLVTIMSMESLNVDKSILSDETCELVNQPTMERVLPDLVDIQKNLEKQLPIYMVPQTWAVLKKLPMLVSGKLDRKRISSWLENIDERSYGRIMQDYDDIKRGEVEPEEEEEDDGKGTLLNTLRDIFAQVLSIPTDNIDLSRSFVSLGGDSIIGMAVVSKARKQGIEVTLHSVLQSKSISELAAMSSAKTNAVQHKEKSGELFGLSPIQRLYFESASAFDGSARFNQSMTVRISRSIKPDTLRQAVQAVIERHSMFRARFTKSHGGRWQQKTKDTVESSYRFRIHTVNSPKAVFPQIGESQQSLDIENGPTFAADLFEVQGSQQILFLVANHLCVDMVSWRIVLQDLEEFIESGSLHSERPISFQSWCEVQVENSKIGINNIELPFEMETPNLSYWGMDGALNVYGNAKMESFALSEDATALVLEHGRRILRAEAIDVVLSTIVHGFRQVFNDRDIPTIYNEGHGRDAEDSTLDLSRTVGWFTTICPLRVSKGSDIMETLKYVKDTRRQITTDGQAYFAQNMLHQTGATKFPVPFEIIFNYLGQLQQLERNDSLFQHFGKTFDSERLEVAGDMGPKTPRFALLEVSAIIVKEKLHVSFTYNRQMKHESRILEWMAECKRILEEDFLYSKDRVPEPTLTDYPLLNMTYNGLRRLVKDTIPSVGMKSWDEVEDVYPCSPVQEGILLSQLRDPQKYIFHVIFEVRHHNERKRIDPTQLRDAWMMVVNRHQVLRTLFVDSNSKGGSFDQLVIKSVGDEIVEFQCEDDVVFKTLDSIKLRDINEKRSWNLPQQLSICQTTSGRVFMKIEMNHAIIDGGSVAIILRDLALAYNNNLVAGSGPRFSEYIKYSRKQDQKEALAYWKRYLSGVDPCHLSFSTKAKGERQLGSMMMNFDRFPELQQFCEKNSVTLATLTLAAWAIVLREFTGSNDVSFGYPSAGRDSPVPGIQDAVGIFINMLCCRVNFVSNHTLLDVSKMVQENHIKSIPHQNCSLAEIQHQLGRQGQALFNTTISIQNHTESKVAKKDMISFDTQHAYDPTEYPVTVNVETARGHEGILLRFWTDAVSESQAKDLADSIAKVFTCFVEEPFRLVSDLALAEPAHIHNQLPKGHGLPDLQMLNHDYLQRLIDQRVNEAISQMIKSGKLVLAQSDGQNKNQPNEYQLKGSDSHLQADDTQKMTLSDSVPTLMGDKETSELEGRLRKLWNTALGRSETAIKHQDSFFKLGGDSITAMKMVGVAREEGLVLTVADVFNNPVFGDMLAILSARDSPASSSASTPPLTPENEKAIETPFILSRPETPNELTVLRSSEVDSSSLRAGISPKIGVFRGGIADVLPVTDFQALSLTASLFKSRWMLNYFFLDGQGPLDIRRLRESFLRVVDAFDILRTVFVCFHGQFFQVILRKVRPEIFVCETDKSLDDYTESLQQQDRAQIPRQGEQYVQFHIVKKKMSDQHRILVRMHHAQFDGVCLPRIMSAIKTGYEGSAIPPTTSFSNYMRVLPASITPEHYQHWKALLKGSQMTEIIRREAPNNFRHIGAFTEQKKTIHFPPTVLENVTIATVMQSAWAMTLAKLTAHADVVFGLTISGRNATIPGIEATVGPCLNLIPVRVKFGERWTGLDLFRYLQDQQVANMPYESLGFREIIRHCTDWSDSTHFTTSVFHQNVEYEGQMQLDDNHYRMGGVGVIDNFTDLNLFSKGFPNQQKLEISLGYSLKGPIQSPFATEVLEMVCETVQNLISNPNIPLPSPSTFRTLSCQVVNDLPRSSDEVFLSSNLNSRSISEILVHSDLLTQTWRQVLSSNSNNAHRARGTGNDQNPYQLNSSFFDLGGDILSMAQVVWLLEQEGLQVRLEDLLEHPTFLGQLAVLTLHNDRADRQNEDAVRNETNSNNHIAPSNELTTSSPAPDTSSASVSSKALTKKETWNPLGRAFTLARKFTKWGSVSSRN
ncbi:nonribosomal peptide synthase Pes1 [Aspergillus steynii IBT 23096]|uniref:Nonribosomal peptide synthase Pes1 n=1 Tax=Aspergillus steynii IBT 23096 TaxID=1392250 RepID=A0A2I2FTD7_9EURO|nr:nonribosomal peptide synthase Pes1 [Aspergillus steynii IBT 23096]PLB43886.1 nonribosomal peptide synthase Pes1 [Aspergillus steynii IBT 23096]